jgi:tRNA wybutosine-synthesizing protein 1
MKFTEIISMECVEKLKREYLKQGYKFIGDYSLLKPCYWLKASLTSRGKNVCYKQKFYGIPSHRCLQLSPTITCTHECIYCWRIQASDIGIEWNELNIPKWDDPEKIVFNGLKMQREVLSGFKGNKNVNGNMLEEAFRPIHAAISLVGEPTLYPYIDDLIYEFFKHNFKTVFLVSNGTRPDALERLSNEPSQLYISLSAPDYETYKKVCRPKIPNGWENIMRSMELIKSFSCPTVIRLTLVRELNLKKVEDYAKIAEKANPTYVEPKAAMSLGGFQYRLSSTHMPSFEEILEFGKRMSELTSLKIIDASEPSRIVLLSRLDKPIKLI